MKKVIIGAVLFSPMLAFAQTGGSLTNVTNLIISVKNIVNILIPLVGALALLYFFWGLAKYILASDDEEARKSGKDIMIWGIVALFVMVSVWGLVRFIGDALLGGQSPTTQTIPTIGN